VVRRLRYGMVAIRWAGRVLFIWISAKGRVLSESGKGDPVRMLGTVLDVTEAGSARWSRRKESEAKCFSRDHFDF
jgi:hypothetical protein